MGALSIGSPEEKICSVLPSAGLLCNQVNIWDSSSVDKVARTQSSIWYTYIFTLHMQN
jgi:hypothetical protein